MKLIFTGSDGAGKTLISKYMAVAVSNTNKNTAFLTFDDNTDAVLPGLETERLLTSSIGNDDITEYAVAYSDNLDIYSASKMLISNSIENLIEKMEKMYEVLVIDMNLKMASSFMKNKNDDDGIYMITDYNISNQKHIKETLLELYEDAGKKIKKMPSFNIIKNKLASTKIDKKTDEVLYPVNELKTYTINFDFQIIDADIENAEIEELRLAKLGKEFQNTLLKIIEDAGLVEITEKKSKGLFKRKNNKKKLIFGR